MIICLDFDGTYSEDTKLWDLFIETAKASGHSIICCTMRDESEGEIVRNYLQDKVHKIIYTSRKAKAPFLASLGITVDIWIDDSPHWILQDSQ